MNESDNATADLLAEIRRLRVRVMRLSVHELNEQVAGRTRRCHMRTFLSTVAQLDPVVAGSNERAHVPDLGDRALADQVVVLLTECLPAHGAEKPVTHRALILARELRRAL